MCLNHKHLNSVEENTKPQYFQRRLDSMLKNVRWLAILQVGMIVSLILMVIFSGDNSFIGMTIAMGICACLSIIIYLFRNRYPNLILYLMPIEYLTNLIVIQTLNTTIYDKLAPWYSIVQMIEIQFGALAFHGLVFSPSFKYCILVYCPIFLLISTVIYVLFLINLGYVLTES